MPFISNLKEPACVSKQDSLELVTLRYVFKTTLHLDAKWAS